MADQWDEFGDAPTAKGGDPFGEFSDAPAAAPLKITVKRLNGKPVTFEVPADADDATVRKLAVRATGEKRYTNSQVNRPEGAAPVATPEATDNSALSGFIGGVLKPIDKAAEWIDNTRFGRAVDEFGQRLGFPSVAEANAANEQLRQNNTRTGYQTLGNIAGTLPVALATRGQGIVPLAAGGGATGALLTDSHDAHGTLADAGLGAVTGVVGGKALQGLGSLARGVTDKGARLLNEAGVPMTLGQIGQAAGNLPGRIASGLEDRMAGIPLIGDVINNARDRGVKAFNTALGNRILSNIGEAVPAGVEAGKDMLAAVQGKLSTAYNRLVPQLTATADQQFGQDLSAALSTADQANRAKQLQNVVTNVFKGRVQNGTISGQMLKDAESELTRLYGKYKNAQGDEGLYGEAIDQVRQGLRGLVARSNPEHAAELQGLNTGWAQLKTLRNAVRTGSDQTKATGIVTPGGALRATTRQGYEEPFLDAATQILPNRVPDSGTAGRAALALGLGSAGAASVVDPREHPYLTATLGALAAANTRGGQRALNTLAFGSRPAVVEAAGEGLQRLSRYAPQLVAPAAVGSER